MTSLPVSFFYPYSEELKDLSALDLDDFLFWSHEGKERRRAWILQTYLRLRRAAYSVSISDRLPSEGLVILLPEPEILDAFRTQFSSLHRRLIVVTVRADVVGFRPLTGDFDIVQNGCFADDESVFFVPHWPQPGLLPRNSDREATIENIVFKGGYGSLDAAYRTERWQAFLADRGLQFHIASAETEGTIPNWHDYRTADLNLAVRPPFNDGGLRCEKPASKLVNAWHAGVPSLLGPEYAFRELRTSVLDYIEVETLEDTMTAVDRLRAFPSLYLRMAEHGRRRAQDFTAERITERWAEILFDRIPAAAARVPKRWSLRLPRPLRTGINFLRPLPSRYELRKLAGHRVRALRKAS